MVSDGDCVVAIDVGGTNLKGALVGRDGRMLTERAQPSGVSAGPEAVTTTVLGLARELSRAAESERETPVAIGLAVPGIVVERTGTVVEATNIGWRDLDLRSAAEEVLALPVTVIHDTRAAAVAEGLVGVARGHSEFLLLTLGTGVGAAVVIGGRPYTGAHGLGGELGHVCVQPHGPQCGCGGQGCLEAMASAGHLAARYRAMADCEHDVDAAAVVQRAAAGDAIAIGVWREAVEALAQAIANYLTLLDPEMVVLGGGLACAGPELLDPVRERVRGLLRFGTPCPIVRAVLGEHAGRVGAAITAWRAAGAEDATLAGWTAA